MLSCLRFCRSGESDALFQQAVKAVSGVPDVEVVWVGEEVEPDKNLIYVLASFDTPRYNSLLNKCRIIGPAVVLAHLEHGWPFPASSQPVFSLAMHGVVACFTQAGNKENREKLTQLVRLMGGKVEGDFTKRVTHLIAGHVGSTKYHVARKLRLPVLLPSWVESCWGDGLKQVIYATDPTTFPPHQAPPFTGITITVTGLDEKARSKVKNTCSENGGKYSGELTKDVCTHLLVGNKSSTKYRYARQWKMHCVTSQWFYDSVDCGYCMPEVEYDVDGSGGAEKEPEKAENGWRKSLESFKLPTVADDEFLDGCKIFLTGFSEEELMVVYKIVNLGGGVRLDRLSEEISHVVMGDREQSVVTTIQHLNSSPRVVSAQWLLDCCSIGERVNEEDYLCLHSGESMTAGKKRKLPDDKNDGIDAAKRPCYQGYDDNELLDEEDLMNQYKMRDSLTEAPPTGSGVLSGYSLSVSRRIPAEDRKMSVRVITEQGGKVVSPPNGSFYILPIEFFEESAMQQSEATHVTMIWVLHSIDAGTLLEPSSHFLFMPMATPISTTTLSGCVLAFSQFSDIEREHLIRLSKSLGAVVQDHFARYPAHGLLATTHLIMKHPSGDKYSFSVKWGVPAVTDSWLFACAKARIIVAIDSHLVSLQEVAPPLSVPTLPLSSAAPPTSLSNNVQASLSTSKECDVERAEPMKDVKGRLTILSGVVIALSKKLGTQEAQLKSLALEMGAEFKKRLDHKCTHYVYQGKATEALRDREVKMAKEQDCFIVSPHWITACSERCARVEEADYPHTYNPNMALAGLSMPRNTLSQLQAKTTSTHLDAPQSNTMHGNETGSEDDTDSYNSESDTDDTKVASSEAAKRLQEHLEQIKEAPMDQHKKRRSRRLLGKEDKTNEAPPPSHQPHHRKSPHKKGRSRRDRRGKRKEEQLLESQVTDSQLLQVTYDDPNGRKEREKLLAKIDRGDKLKTRGLEISEAVGDDAPPKSIDCPLSENKHQVLKPQSSKDSISSNKLVCDNDLPPSTPAAPSLNVPIVTHASKGGGVQQLYDERNTSITTRTRRQCQPKILLSSLDQREKLDYGALIQDLGGDYIDQDYFSPKCTHLVVGRASRTEKYLGACAAGKWVLHKSFLEESRACGAFVKEESHEWGVAKAGGTIQPLEAAPKTWRLALAEKQRQNPGQSVSGAFDGWKVLLFAERNKVPGMKRLLEAGGAQVLTPSSHKAATHAFISISYFPKDSLSLEQLVNNGVHCLKPDYIADYLAKGSALKTESLYINEVKSLTRRV
ncbi:DNA topoisomerase 2-binding protein 1-A-like isoform X3 [Halichondria panicea]|uniref:DNA topoisomerase 2-binding protein 1-A-like isoform X3 n=1 Tax=Halichondria panicea TaxID=6063 RepID=UPI00312B8CEC